MNNNDNFFKPLLSTLGLLISFIVAVLPLLTKTSLSDYFVNQELSYPASLISAILGIMVTWIVMTFYPYMQINIGKSFDRGNGYSQYWKTLGPAQITWIVMLVEIILFVLFFSFPDETSRLLQIIQATIYIIFFDLLIFIFALLVSNTKSQFEYREQKDKFAERVFRTLEKNKLISPGISIYENQVVTFDEAKSLDIRHIGMTRKIKLQTVAQKLETIEIIVSDDGNELIKLIKKHEE